MSARGVRVSDARKMLLKLDGVVEGTSYRMPSFLVNGRFFARFRDDDTVLVLQLKAIADRDVLMEIDPQAFFFTDALPELPRRSRPARRSPAVALGRCRQGSVAARVDPSSGPAAAETRATPSSETAKAEAELAVGAHLRPTFAGSGMGAGARQPPLLVAQPPVARPPSSPRAPPHRASRAPSSGRSPRRRNSR